MQNETKVSVELPPVELPKVEITAKAPEPLFDSTHGFVAASRKLITHKLYDDDDEGDGEVAP